MSTVTIDFQNTKVGGYTLKGKASLDLGNIVIEPVEQEDDFGYMHGINTNVGVVSSATTVAKKHKFISDNSFEIVRVPVYWEFYESDMAGQRAKLKATADAADAAGLHVIYDFHQVKVSSVFGGTGFPPNIVRAFTSKTGDEGQIEFMRKYWANTKYNGRAIWDLHAEFMINAMAEFRSRPSTFGYEIFNEAAVTQDSEHERMKLMQEHIGNMLVDVDPDAWIVATHPFTKGVSDAVKSSWGGFWGVARTIRTIPVINNGKVIYGPHTYWDVGTSGVAQAPKFEFDKIKQIQIQSGAKVMIGEWGVRGATSDQAAMKRIIDRAILEDWPLLLWIFDSKADANNSCFTINYDINTKRFYWNALLGAMGVSQVGSPK